LVLHLPRHSLTADPSHSLFFSIFVSFAWIEQQSHNFRQSSSSIMFAPFTARLSVATTVAPLVKLAVRTYGATPATSDRIVVAVGGNALQRRGERLTIENMLKAAAEMAPTIKQLASEHELVLTHGNGPQVGELALERSAATFDVLGAESMGQIGYVLAQALQSVGVKTVPILTQVVVDDRSPAFRNPTKFVGPVYGPKEAHALAESLGWTVKPDGEYFRRVVPSPAPLEILQIDAVKCLLEHAPDILPIACGGGGIPVTRVPSRPETLQGVEAVIDKDACGSKLAIDLQADGFIILTDGGGIWKNFGKPDAAEMAEVTPEYLRGTKAGKAFPGSMGPKIEAAIDFVEKSKNPNAVWAAIGDLKDAAKILSNEEGTLIKNQVSSPEHVVWRERAPDPEQESKPPRLSQDPPKYG
jgi:carbamate kinase